MREKVQLEADASFCTSEDVVATLISGFNWYIADSGLACPNGGEVAILRFELDEEIAPAVIDDENHAISISVSRGNNINELKPTVYISRGATSSPASEATVDFS